MTQPLSSHGTLLKMGDGVGVTGTPTFVGVGLDDLTMDAASVYRGHRTAAYWVEIDLADTIDTFKWSRDGGVTWEAENIPIAGAAQEMELELGLLIEHAAVTGHTLGDYWTIAVNPVFTVVAELVDASGPGIEQATHDAPSQDTTWMKRVAGIVSAGDYTFDVNFIPKDQTHDGTSGLVSLLGLQFTTAWQLLYNDAGSGTESQWVWSGYLVTFGEDIPVDGILKSSVTLKINGKPDFIKGT
jgi:hypothetical protein